MPFQVRKETVLIERGCCQIVLGLCCLRNKEKNTSFRVLFVSAEQFWSDQYTSYWCSPGDGGYRN